MTSLLDRSEATIRIVVVEDDTANRLFFTDYLIFAGFDVLPLPHGLDLDHHLKEFQPQVLLLDLGLPEVDGYTLLQQLRALPRWQQLPVIVVSGYAFAEDQHRALALGAQNYLVKPVPLHQLIQAVQAVLQPSHSLGTSQDIKSQRHSRAEPAPAKAWGGNPLWSKLPHLDSRIHGNDSH